MKTVNRGDPKVKQISFETVIISKKTDPNWISGLLNMENCLINRFKPNWSDIAVLVEETFFLLIIKERVRGAETSPSISSLQWAHVLGDPDKTPFYCLTINRQWLVQ